jgi:hypothetical protein
MNRIRILKLKEEDREKYIRDGLAGKTINELRHMVSEYGIRDCQSLTKQELEDIIVDALSEWESDEHKIPSYRNKVMLFVPEYKPGLGTCGVSGCKQVVFKRGICSKHFYEYQQTPTGTYKPAWLDYLEKNQSSIEKKYHNSEMPFSWLEDGGELLIG